MILAARLVRMDEGAAVSRYSGGTRPIQDPASKLDSMTTEVEQSTTAFAGSRLTVVGVKQIPSSRIDFFVFPSRDVPGQI